ncbi:uncharacterized protein LOC114280229 [Camellia sinensis]|uniref:uncharacterized protein LOC114280229 n=1 Tax=Camellia sinensis TaxID=4442 RepID=UPI001035AB52|nr:uncharacterized protein LOC114280229 [Camellia sinensis]
MQGLESSNLWRSAAEFECSTSNQACPWMYLQEHPGLEDGKKWGVYYTIRFPLSLHQMVTSLSEYKARPRVHRVGSQASGFSDGDGSDGHEPAQPLQDSDPFPDPGSTGQQDLQYLH